MRWEDTPPSTPVHGGVTTISAVHPDVLQTHILTRLDGPTLASAACASPHLHALATQDTLWQQLCHRRWPSTADPSLRRLISSCFPSGHRSFYSDSFQYLDHHRRSRPSRRPPPPFIISAVDIRYQDQLLLSKVHVAETGSDPSVPFRVDLLGPKDAAVTLPMPMNLDIRDDKCLCNLRENMTLSWILIDPTRARARAADVSSRLPVMVRRVNWVADAVELCYATVLSGGELVQCLVRVTRGGGGELVLGEVRLRVVDMEGRKLGWKSLEAAVEGGRKRRVETGEGRERYESWWREERERRRRKRRRESRRDAVAFTVIVIFLFSLLASFLVFVGIKFFQLLSWFSP